jgi:hypothetical protein
MGCGILSSLTQGRLDSGKLGLWDVTPMSYSNKLKEAEQDAPSNGGQRSSLNSGFLPRRG